MNTVSSHAWIRNKEFKLGKKLGAGAFGEVFQALSPAGQLYAVKKLNMRNKPEEIKNLMQEIQLMSSLSHKNIVAYIGSYVDPADSNVYIVQEWVPGGSIESLIKQFGPLAITAARSYMRQVVEGLVYLHSKNIVHRDIKADNILVDVGTVKLADFGASTSFEGFEETQATKAIHGTPYFMAPEVLSNSKYGRKGDVWAVGCLLIQMLTGQPPWKERKLQGIVQLHILLSTWNGPPPCSAPLPPDAQEYLELCCKKEESDRPSAVELLQTRFLREDASAKSTDDDEDILSQTGMLRGLKMQMEEAASRTPSNNISLGDFSPSAQGARTPGSGSGPPSISSPGAPARERPRGFSNVNNPYANGGVAGAAAVKSQPNPYGASAAASSGEVNPYAAAAAAPSAQARSKDSAPCDTNRYSHKHVADDASDTRNNSSSMSSTTDSKLSRSGLTDNERTQDNQAPHAPSHYEADYKDDFHAETYSSQHRPVDAKSAGRGSSAFDRSTSRELDHRRHEEAYRETRTGKDRRGEQVEANYRNSGTWYPGVIKRDRGDGTYDIDYDDGELETRVLKINMRPRGVTAPKASTSRVVAARTTQYDVDDDDEDYEVDPITGAEVVYSGGSSSSIKHNASSSASYDRGAYLEQEYGNNDDDDYESAKSPTKYAPSSRAPAPHSTGSGGALGVVRKAPKGRSLGGTGGSGPAPRTRAPNVHRSNHRPVPRDGDDDDEYGGEDDFEAGEGVEEEWQCSHCNEMSTGPYCLNCAHTRKKGYNLTH